jgi:hypothetical protein
VITVFAVDPMLERGMVLAHGLGGRTDLPVDRVLAATGAALAVAVTVLVIPSWWQASRLEDQQAGRPLPVALGRILDAPWFTYVVRSLALALSLFVVIVAFLGPAESRFNLAPYALYVVFWVGLVPASLLFGPVWRRLNPLRLVHELLSRLLRVDPDQGLHRLPVAVGLWPAAGWLLIFVWLELVFPGRALPSVVGLFLLLYALVTLTLALLFGRGWFAAGDGFEVYSTLIGSLAPFGRREDDTLVLRSPLRSLATVPHTPGLTAVAAVLIGSTGFDGLTRTQFWQRNVPPDSLLLGTVGLLIPAVVVGVLFLVAIKVGRREARPREGGEADTFTADRFAHSLVPVALGYAVAHYFSFLLFEGQVALALLSEPFRLGWDLFGTAERRVDYLLVSPTTIAWVQVGAIVVGHIVGILAAHDRALALLDHRRVAASQWPLGMVMMAITGCGVLLLVSV